MTLAHISSKNNLFSPRLSFGVILLLGLAVYSNCFNNPFVFDDNSLLGNENIQELWPIYKPFLWSGESATAGRPILSFSFALNYALGGDKPFGYHLVNLLIHILNSFFLYLIIQGTFRTPRLASSFSFVASPLAFVAALIWLVHPIHTECINYITQRSELLMGFFYLGTIYAALRSWEGENKKTWLCLSAVFCALGMATKEVMVTAPLLVFFYDYAFGGKNLRETFRERKILYLCLAATWLILLGLILSNPRSSSVGFSHKISSLDYLISQSYIIIHYLQTLFWPNVLVFDYGMAQAEVFSEHIFSFLAMTGLFLGSLGLYIYRPYLGFAPLSFFLILAPSSSFVPIVTEVGAERRVYLSSALIIGLIAGLAYAWLSSRKEKIVTRQKSYFFALALAFLVISVLSYRSFLRNNDYANKVRIWESALQAVPDNPRAYHNLGVALGDRKEFQKSQECFEKALALKPRYASCHYHLSLYSLHQGKLEEALGQKEKLRKMAPHHPKLWELYRHLGDYELKREDIDQAYHYYEKILQRHPKSVALLKKLASYALQKGKWDRAFEFYEKALLRKPEDVDTYNVLGMIRLQQGDFPKAMEFYRKATDIDPKSPDAYNNIGVAFERQGDFPGALTYYYQALRLNEESVTTYHNIIMLSVKMGKFRDALHCAQEALKLDPENTNTLRYLGAFLVGQGKIDEGIQHYMKALKINPRDVNIYKSLGSAYEKKKELDKARFFYQKAAQIQKKSSNK